MRLWGLLVVGLLLVGCERSLEANWWRIEGHTGAGELVKVSRLMWGDEAECLEALAFYGNPVGAPGVGPIVGSCRNFYAAPNPMNWTPNFFIRNRDGEPEPIIQGQAHEING